MKKNIEIILEDYELDPTKLTNKEIIECEKKAIDCINGIGDYYEVMASVILLAEALKLERKKNKTP